MTTPKVSIVVPAHNAGPHLRRCLQSLRAQSLAEIEVLVIDDGSTDDTGTVAQDLVDQDSRFELFSTLNRGVSAARNLGLAKATGEYVTFVDADDWIEPEMYRKMLRAAGGQPFDAIASDLYIHAPKALQIESSDIPGGAYDRTQIEETILPIAISTNALTRPWPYRIVNKLFRREAITEAGVQFADGLRAAQDFVFSIEALTLSQTFYYVKGFAGYHYEHNPQSRTRQPLSTAWANYREVDRRLELIASGDPVLRPQLKFAALHGDLSSLTYLYRNQTSPPALDAYRQLVELLSSTHRRDALNGLDWHKMPRSKRVACSLYRRQHYRMLHSLLLCRGIYQSISEKRFIEVAT